MLYDFGEYKSWKLVEILQWADTLCETLSVWCITEPVMGSAAGESENNDDDDDDDNGCHQMVMAWTLQDWKVNICCEELWFTSEYKNLLD